MSYVLYSAPAVFQAFISEVLTAMLHMYVMVCTDHILVYSHSLEEHIFVLAYLSK